MASEVKICPECGAEYFAHVSTCNACEVALVDPDRKAEAAPETGEGAFVCIEEGDLARVTELSRGLGPRGVEFRILRLAPGKSCSGGGYGIFVAREKARQAARAIDEMWRKLYPEIEETEDRMSAGLCPACGAQAGDASECPDCGLNLGGGPGGGDCGGGCGTCN